MKVAVVGLGFVGLATVLAFAEKGFKVAGYDNDPARMKMLRDGKLPFHEPGLDLALIRHSGHNLTLARDIAEAMENADVAFFCVGTPSNSISCSSAAYVPPRRPDAVVVSNSIDFSPSAPMSAPSVKPKMYFVSSS